MIALKLFYAIALPVIIGAIPLSWFLPKREDGPFYLRWAMGWGLGTIMLTRSMELMGLIGWKFSVLSITAFWLPFVLLGGGFSLYMRYEIFDLNGVAASAKTFSGIAIAKGRKALIGKLIALVLAFKVLYVFYEALIKPVTAWDAWAYWILMAKVFFVERTATPALAALTRGAEQPWHMPLLNTWMFLNLGAFNDVLSEIIYPIYFVALLCVFYAALRAHFSRIRSLFFTFLVSSIPFYLYHATISYADSLVTFYACASFVLFYNFIKGHKERDLVLSFLFVVFSFLVKKQGYLYFVVWVIATIAYVLVKKPQLFGMAAAKYLKYLFALIGLAALSGLSLMVVLVGRGDISFMPHVERLPVILNVFYNKLFMMGNWNIAWFVFVLISVLGFQKIIRSDAAYIFSISMLNLMMLFLFYLFGGQALFVLLLDGTVLNRYLVQFTPFLVLCIAEGFDLFRAGVKAPMKRK